MRHDRAIEQIGQHVEDGESFGHGGFGMLLHAGPIEQGARALQRLVVAQHGVGEWAVEDDVEPFVGQLGDLPAHLRRIVRGDESGLEPDTIGQRGRGKEADQVEIEAIADEQCLDLHLRFAG